MTEQQHQTEAACVASELTQMLGLVAYEAAAESTGCAQPWAEANQAMWIAAAAAVTEACAQMCEWLPYGTGLAGKTYAEALRGTGMGAKLAEGFTPNRPTCAVGGMVRPGAMCGAVIVGGKFCGHAGECQHKVLSAKVSGAEGVRVEGTVIQHN